MEVLLTNMNKEFKNVYLNNVEYNSNNNIPRSNKMIFNIQDNNKIKERKKSKINNNDEKGINERNLENKNEIISYIIKMKDDNYFENKENINNNENISYVSKGYQPCYHKTVERKPKKYNNKNVNELSNYVQKLINENTSIEEKIHDSQKDEIIIAQKNNLLLDRINKRKKNKKINNINFNENLLSSKYSSTINLFKRNEKKNLNNNNKIKTFIPFPKTEKNKRQIINRKNNYINNLELENKTYLNKINEILNTNLNECERTKNSKNNKFIKRINSFSSNLNLNEKLIRKKSFICFNKDKNQSFSYRNIESNFLIICNSNFKKNIGNNILIENNNEKKNNNSKCINVKNSIFNFERLSKLKKYYTQNESKISVDKFNNEDGTKDDIIYKKNKIKYLSPKMNSKNIKQHFLVRPKNKKILNDIANNYTRFESSIKYTKTLLNKIKLDNNIIVSKDYNTKNCIFNDESNYFKIENKSKEFNKNKNSNLISSSNLGRNSRLKYLSFKNINKYKTLNKGIYLNFSNNDSLNDDKEEI